MAQEDTQQSDYNIHWRRNLAVCFVGSFSTLIAMTLLLPFLPLYVEQLGAQGHAAIVQWSGIAYGATFFAAAMVAPLWGRLGDRYGRKVMLVRASFGMAICMSLTGMVETVWQLVLLRLLIGFAVDVDVAGFGRGFSLIRKVVARKARKMTPPDNRKVARMPITGGSAPPSRGPTSEPAVIPADSTPSAQPERSLGVCMATNMVEPEE